MEHTRNCPVCGSSRIVQSDESEVLNVPYGPASIFLRSIEHCADCGESGDFENVNDDRIEQAFSESVKQSIISMIDDLSQQGLSMAYLERSLDLPQRTLARLKRGESSAAAIALLRIVRTFPWITQVAESGYDPICANSMLASQAVVVFGRLANTAGFQVKAHVYSDVDSVHLSAHFAKEREEDSLPDSASRPSVIPWARVTSS